MKEMGQHDQLVAADGIYASTWKVQTGEARSGDAVATPRRKSRVN